MTKNKESQHSEVDVSTVLRDMQKEDLSFEEALDIQEDFLHQGLEYWLNDFRKKNAITQKQLADSMGISQPAVCQMLKKPSRLATLGRLVQAMGGHIDITVTKDGRTTSLLFGTPVNEVLAEQLSSRK